MVQTLQAKETTLRDLIITFGIQLVEDESFFWEWQDNLPELTTLDKQLLDKVKVGYINLLNYPPVLEDIVRMAVLDPILFIGDFYLFPFYVKSEESVDIISEDDDVIVKAKIDTLVLKDQFWVMVIESKRAAFSIEEGLAQILAYMLGNSNAEQPSFGMITTGGSFVFVKLVKGKVPQYALSKVFITRNPGNDLYDVLRILKRLSQLVNESGGDVTSD
ncbi:MULTISPECIES: restriction endonuclease subunit R [unclassified Coleofasciculus]|uniref:restriction endonuclease subunit R n=1 Tax=unclassified Coleofasciculus TaxID=2692782 RepID=UPI00187F805A|nr:MULTISPECIES: restriction endonuclease subunit R [unclassified Coleofasciculus]MBE9126391.1 restriction endonuclease subunit R [Coleofasciculus sp. LEGE 07081]MBE9149830.1 restriction endonuclease subunit R [Coleofasciculus sp. LEGE 07092]